MKKWKKCNEKAFKRIKISHPSSIIVLDLANTTDTGIIPF